jgi:hypothetical protein
MPTPPNTSAVIEQLQALAEDLRAELQTTRQALVRFALADIESHFHRQSQLCAELAPLLRHLPEMPPAVRQDALAALHASFSGVQALNQVQKRLVASGEQSVKIRINAARLASDEGSAYGDK